MMDATTLCVWASARLARIQQDVTPDLTLSWKPSDGKSLVKAASKFLENVNATCFPIFEGFFYGDGDPRWVIELLDNPVPVSPLGYDPWDGEERYHEHDKDDPYRLFLLLMELFHLQYDEDEMWKAFHELRDKWELDRPAPPAMLYVALKNVFDKEELPEWMDGDRELWQGMMHLCQYLVASTGCPFLDVSMTEWSYSVGGFDWGETGQLKELWREGKPIWDSLLSFLAWSREHESKAATMVRVLCSKIDYSLEEALDLPAEDIQRHLERTEGTDGQE
jgi:hypothetical protein